MPKQCAKVINSKTDEEEE